MHEQIAKAKFHADQLREKIAYHNDLYHGKDEPIISDADFDKLVYELRSLEDKYPQIKKVIAQPVSLLKKQFTPTRHAKPMQSLQSYTTDINISRSSRSTVGYTIISAPRANSNCSVT